jgi:hypothetical protein
MKSPVSELLKRRSQLLEIIARAADEVDEIDKQLEAMEGVKVTG